MPANDEGQDVCPAERIKELAPEALDLRLVVVVQFVLAHARQLCPHNVVEAPKACSFFAALYRAGRRELDQGVDPLGAIGVVPVHQAHEKGLLPRQRQGRICARQRDVAPVRALRTRCNAKAQVRGEACRCGRGVERDKINSSRRLDSFDDHSNFFALFSVFGTLG